jgi:anti-sigma-K factor RskA
VPGAVFEAYADNSVRILSLDDFEVPAGKTLQAWTLYDQSVGPVSLGTFAKSDEVRLKGPAQPPPKADQLYEITLEPESGSPTGKPTGPILVKGFCAKDDRGLKSSRSRPAWISGALMKSFQNRPERKFSIIAMIGP